jgi:hypothetical protein
MPKEYTLTKKPIRGGSTFLYTVTDGQGNTIGTRTSDRTYIACYVLQDNPDGQPYTQYWFGREQLIGKGSSSSVSPTRLLGIARLKIA